jgi:CubicO group peptidase (beta-lactamase class C family)
MPLSDPTHPDTLVPVSPQEAGHDPEGLRHVEQVMRDGLGTVYPAAALLVARNSRVVLHHAYGYLEPETGQRPTQLDSLFDLASVSKLSTATAFMTLVVALLTNCVYYGRDPAGIAELRPRLHDAVVRALR